MSHAVLTISSRNYSSWSLRGWLLCKLAGLELSEEMVPIDSPGQRAELLLLSPSVLVPRLTHEGASVWDTLAIAEYLAETFPDAGLYPEDKLARAHCRSISGEIHSGFHNLRSALPMNLKARHDSFRLFAGAKPDIERVHAIWRDCLERHGGPWLFGAKRYLRHPARCGLPRLCEDDHRLAADAAMDQGRAGRTRRGRGTRR